MAYKSFAQRLAESFNPVVEKDEEVQNVDGIVDPKIATAFHDLVVGLIATDMSEAFAASSAAEQYTDLVEALQELHAQVCPGEELVFPGTEEDTPDGDDGDEKVNELLEATGPQDIQDVVEYFPKGAGKAIQALANRGDLKFGDFKVDITGRGLTLDDMPSDVDVDVSTTARYGDTDVDIEIDVLGDVLDVIGGAYDAAADELNLVVSLTMNDTADVWAHIVNIAEDEVEVDEESEDYGDFSQSISDDIFGTQYALLTVSRSGNFTAEHLTGGYNEAKAIVGQYKDKVLT